MKNKFDTKKLGVQLENLLILICLGGLIFLFVNYNMAIVGNTNNFYKSWHNVDLTLNILRITNVVNTQEKSFSLNFENTTDVGADMVERKLTDYYISGMNGIDESYMASIRYSSQYFIWALLDVFILGLLLSNKLGDKK